MKLRVDSELVVRSVADTDAEALFLVIDGHRLFLRRWLPWVDQTRTPADTAAFVSMSRENERAGTGLAAIIEAQGEICGVIGLDRIDRVHHSSEIGYWVREDCQGRGLVTRAAGALVGHAFGSLALNRLAIRAAVENRRSRAVAERLGFVQEGILREAARQNGDFIDLVSYSLLRRDALPARGRAVAPTSPGS